MRDKMIAWMAGVVSIVVILMVIIVTMKPPKDGIIRAQIFKAMALAITAEDECSRREKERGSSRFSAKEKDNWFVKYMDYLYDKGYPDEGMTTPSLSTAQGYLTYQEAVFMTGQVPNKLKLQAGATKHNGDRAFPEEEWWRLYEGTLSQTDPDGTVKTVDAVLYGTPSNLPQTESWTAYTTEGNFGFQGFALDAYLDCEIQFLVRGDEMITMRQLISEDVVYESIWLAESGGRHFKAYLGTAYREFPVSDKVGDVTDMAGNLADLHMEGGKLRKITMKRERISGKVLPVTDNAIEIEGYDEISLSENFHVYKVYGDSKVLGAKDILVGYDLQEFVAVEGKLRVALLEWEFDAKTIHVLPMDTGFKSLYCPSAALVLGGAAQMEYENSKDKTEKEHLEAGTQLTVALDDECLKYGRIIITPEGDEGIAVSTVERSQGTPVYSGKMEIKACEEGLVLVDDLSLEDYLTRVVSSEMPPSYEKGALKAQAVCARTHAYHQIQGNSYSQYGAHVDGSTSFQVYNNTNPDERTTQAAKETCGKMLFYENNPIDAFYFSTSCGHTADASVWGTDADKLPYLQVVEVESGRRILGQGDNDKFDSYIRSSDASTYDSSLAMFRWGTDISSDIISARVSGAGKVTDTTVVSRGPGGIASELQVTGSDGTVTVKGQSAIRSTLDSSSLVITKQDGKTMEGSQTLPSAFISTEKRSGEDGSISSHVYGGGFGHSVGMSQNGAQGMVKEGKDYTAILSLFYNGTELREIGN